MPQATNHFVLDNATLWIGDGSSYLGHVEIRDGKIAKVGPGRYRGELPSEDLYEKALSPGLIDLMVLGGFGLSLLRDNPLDIARRYLKLGVTACQFCSGTLPWEVMVRVADNIRKSREYSGSDAATIIGYYPEGPFQDPELTGASLRENSLPPTPENVKRFLHDIGDVVTQVNVAPGVEGDAVAVAALHAAGKVVSMAHSNAPAERVVQCVESGTSVLGHIWDNNSGLIGDSGVQQPTIEQVALTDERVRYIHLICDGIHVHPIMIQMTLRCRGVESICLVTDAVSLAGCADGTFLNDDGREFVKQGGVGRTDTGGLCGSALLLPDMLRNFVRFSGLPPQQAIRTVTLNPARSLGLDGQMGILAHGRLADLVLWNDRLQVQRVWKSGVECEDIDDVGEVQLC
jgi:N-acetylglucosamine-6-phosphate deacetylase